MFASLKNLFIAPPEKLAAAKGYAALVARARSLRFYAECAVPDTLDGRFEMILLHLHLVLERLRSVPESALFRRALQEAFFDDMDRSIRELGVSDTGVGKRIKRMATAWFGRHDAYRNSWSDDLLLKSALTRNVYGTLETPPADAALSLLISELRGTEGELSRYSAEQLISGDFFA